MDYDEKISQLNESQYKLEKKLRYYTDKEKILRHQLSQLTRKERTNRLCTRAGMLESFLKRPADLTNDQVMNLLRIAFRQPEVKAAFQR